MQEATYSRMNWVTWASEQGDREEGGGGAGGEDGDTTEGGWLPGSGANAEREFHL